MRVAYTYFKHQGTTYMIKSIYQDITLLDKKLMYHIGKGNYLEVAQDSPIRKEVSLWVF